MKSSSPLFGFWDQADIMDEKAYTELVNCIDMDIHPVSIMNHVSVKTAQSMLAHMRIEY